MNRTLLAGFLLLPIGVSANVCDERVERSLQDLQSRLEIHDPESIAAARAVLLDLCQDTQSVLARESSVARENSEAQAQQAEPRKLLGIEFEKAPPDAAGRSRTRKTP